MRVLLADDEVALLELMKQSLLNEGFSVDAVANKEDIKAHLESYMYQVLVLDRNFDGIDIMNDIISFGKKCNPNMGILVISALSSVDDKVSGLLKGADDYLEKPFDTKELKARIYAISRRFSSNILTFENLSINLETKQILLDNNVIVLSKKESKLIFLLLSKKGRIFSREEIIDALYIHPEGILQNSIDELISRIRKKTNPKLIKTIKTRGFVIE